MTVLKYTYNVFQDNGKCLFLANFVADCHKTMRIDSVVVLGEMSQFYISLFYALIILNCTELLSVELFYEFFSLPLMTLAFYDLTLSNGPKSNAIHLIWRRQI